MNSQLTSTSHRDRYISINHANIISAAMITKIIAVTKATIGGGGVIVKSVTIMTRMVTEIRLFHGSIIRAKIH